MNIRRINRRLKKHFGPAVTATLTDDCIVLGICPPGRKRWKPVPWQPKKYSTTHVVNEIRCDEAGEQSIRIPTLRDTALEGRKPDVLIIGGGISGPPSPGSFPNGNWISCWWKRKPIWHCRLPAAMTARSTPASIFPAALSSTTMSAEEMPCTISSAGNLMFPLSGWGSMSASKKPGLSPSLPSIAASVKSGWHRRYRAHLREELRHREPNLRFAFAISNPSSGCVCPYGLTIAYAENAVQNGAEVSLNTVVLGMEVQDGKIHSVTTNRGTVYPALVINAAGVFAEEIAAMARDRFFSIHPRRGTNSILDKKAGAYMHTIASVMDIARNTHHSKGGGILHTVHDNLLVGPDAIETWEKETPKPTGKASTMCSKSSSAPCTPFPRGISLPTLPGCAPPSKRTSSSKWAAKPATFCTVPVSSPQGLPLPRPSRWISKKWRSIIFPRLNRWKRTKTTIPSVTARPSCGK